MSDTCPRMAHFWTPPAESVDILFRTNYITMLVVKPIKSSYRSILQSKMIFFFRKSMWLYLFSFFVIAYVLPLNGYNWWVSGVIYFLSFCMLILVPLYHISTVRLVKLFNFDALVEFGDEEIVIRHRNKDLVERKDWSWVRSLLFLNASVVLEVRSPSRFLIMLGKDSLTGEEIGFFKSKQKVITTR